MWFPVDFGSAIDLGHDPRQLTPGEQRDAGPIALQDVTVGAGLSAVIGAGNTHGVGVAFVDVSGDGWEDIVVVNGRFVRSTAVFDSALYLSDGDGTFSDATVSSGLAAILDGVDGYSIAAADYDTDGDVDLYVGAHPHDYLLRNQGAGTFVDATSAVQASRQASTCWAACLKVAK